MKKSIISDYLSNELLQGPEDFKVKDEISKVDKKEKLTNKEKQKEFENILNKKISDSTISIYKEYETIRGKNLPAGYKKQDKIDFDDNGDVKQLGENMKLIHTDLEIYYKNNPNYKFLRQKVDNVIFLVDDLQQLEKQKDGLEQQIYKEISHELGLFKKKFDKTDGSDKFDQAKDSAKARIIEERLNPIDNMKDKFNLTNSPWIEILNTSKAENGNYDVDFKFGSEIAKISFDKDMKIIGDGKFSIGDQNFKIEIGKDNKFTITKVEAEVIQDTSLDQVETDPETERQVQEKIRSIENPNQELIGKLEAITFDNAGLVEGKSDFVGRIGRKTNTGQVETVQKSLYNINTFNGYSGIIDGGVKEENFVDDKFSPKTKASVTEFQKMYNEKSGNNIKVDGYPGQQTIDAMVAVLGGDNSTIEINGNEVVDDNDIADDNQIINGGELPTVEVVGRRSIKNEKLFSNPNLKEFINLSNKSYNINEVKHDNYNLNIKGFLNRLNKSELGNTNEIFQRDDKKILSIGLQDESNNKYDFKLFGNGRFGEFVKHEGGSYGLVKDFNTEKATTSIEKDDNNKFSIKFTYDKGKTKEISLDAAGKVQIKDGDKIATMQDPDIADDVTTNTTTENINIDSKLIS